MAGKNTRGNKTALIFGVSGIAGRALGEHLSEIGGWNIIGVSRRAHKDLKIGGARFVSADLMDAPATQKVLKKIANDATHVFFCTWSAQANETENSRVNGAMVRSALEGATTAAPIRHVSLVTGLKHYLGSFETYGTRQVETPFSEEEPRLPGENFYYTQDDVLFEQAEKQGFSWSVARPHTIIGFAPGNAMNLATSLAVYASICRETGGPFVFPGTSQSYNALVDMTDARILAKHLVWEATTRKAANKAFNVVNGDYFRWRKMWRLIAEYFGLEPAPYPGHETPLAKELADIGPVWDGMVQKHRLRPYKIEQVAPWWHVDVDLGRTLECVTDMSRSRELGFLTYQRTWTALQDLFGRLRSERIIP